MSGKVNGENIIVIKEYIFFISGKWLYKPFLCWRGFFLDDRM